MRIRALGAVLLVVCATSLAAQVVIDGIMRVVNGDIVTRLDVRQAMLLKLVSSDPWTDDAVADRLVERRLMLADLARAAIKDPSADVVAQRYKAWQTSLGSGVDLAVLLARAGMTEASVRAWLVDDWRIDTYADQMFRVSAEPTPAEMLAYYQAHVNDYADGGTVKAFVSVQRDVRTALRAETQAKLRAQWLANLKRRANITVVKGG